MELDKRIKEGKRPLTCFDIEEAKKYVGKDCYFSSKFENFENLSKVPHATLHNVDDSHTPFQCYGKDGVLCYDCFILPCEWVKEPEKKYRPFSLNEFLCRYAISDLITYRIIDCETVEQSMLIGFQSNNDEDIPGNGYVLIGNCRYSLKELFNNYELKAGGEWQSFGIEVKDEE